MERRAIWGEGTWGGAGAEPRRARSGAGGSHGGGAHLRVADGPDERGRAVGRRHGRGARLPDLDAVAPRTGDTPLHAAARIGSATICELLLNNNSGPKADKDAKDSDGNTALKDAEAGQVSTPRGHEGRGDYTKCMSLLR